MFNLEARTVFEELDGLSLEELQGQFDTYENAAREQRDELEECFAGLGLRKQLILKLVVRKLETTMLADVKRASLMYAARHSPPPHSLARPKQPRLHELAVAA